MEMSKFYTRPLQAITKFFQTVRLAFTFIVAFGASTLRLSSGSTGNKQVPPDTNNSAADQRPYFRYFLRLRRRLIAGIRKPCRPTSFYIPILCTMFTFIHSFRALENHHITLHGLEEYNEGCPEGSRRTATGACVKLFAATVTTIGLRGHLHSLNGMHSWKFELYRAIETMVNPLATVFDFSTVLWYGFADLLRISAGPWSKGVTLKYRLARLCGCYVYTPSIIEGKISLARVSPQHIEATTLERGMKWSGRLLIVLILFGQYIQAALLLTRRILSNAAAQVDYMMIFLVIVGVITLLQSLFILLLNASWSLCSGTQPCTESLCYLPECVTLKEREGCPSSHNAIITAFGYDISTVPRKILSGLAGGWLQLSVLARSDDSIWNTLMVLWFLQFIWSSSLYFICGIKRLRELSYKDNKPQPDNTQSAAQDQLDQLPRPATENTSNPQSDTSISTKFFLAVIFIAGVAYIAWNLLVLVIQLVLLFGPCIVSYSVLVAEISSWKDMDPGKPCPQLWKDGLEDELWWF